MLRWVVSFGSFEFSFQSIRERCDNQLAIIFFGWVVQPPTTGLPCISLLHVTAGQTGSVRYEHAQHHLSPCCAETEKTHENTISQRLVGSEGRHTQIPCRCFEIVEV